MRIAILFLALIITPAIAQEVEGDPYVDGDYQAHFVSTKPDGIVTVTIGVPKRDIATLPPEATKEEYIEVVRQSSDTCRDDPNCVLMPDDWVPPYDRRLRNAWKKGQGKDKHGNFNDVGEPVRGIDIDMPKARKIWGALIEQAAVDQLRRETVDVRVAEVRGNTKEIEEKKAQRDALFGIMETVTPTLEAAQTPEELMAIWPAELPQDTRPKTPTAADKAAAMQKRAEVKAERRKQVEKIYGRGSDGNANNNLGIGTESRDAPSAPVVAPEAPVVEPLTEPTTK